jgi:FkbM family methyltransferase
LSEFFRLLSDQIEKPINLIDVGAAGGAIEGWQQFGDKARVFCFEARDDESDDLSSANVQSTIEYVPLALSKDDRGIDLTITSNLGCSSVYPPVRQLYRAYPACAQMRPVAVAHCPSTTIDAFMAERGVDRVLSIKLDTQGSELEILRGAERALEQALFLIVETEFNTLYEGQPLFCDVDRFLRDRGFVLWRLGNLCHYSTGKIGGDTHNVLVGTDPVEQQMVPVPHGQLFWGDSFYVKAAATALSEEKLDRDVAIAGAALVSQWNFWDLALEMLRKSGDEHLFNQASDLLGARFVEPGRMHIGAKDFRSNVLRKDDGSSWSTDFSTTDRCIIFGPYVRLPRGDLEAIFHFTQTGLSDGLASPIVLDVAVDRIRLDSVSLEGSAGAQMLWSGAVKLSFFNGSPNGVFEFRVDTAGKPFDGVLTFHGVEVRPVPSELA